MAKNYIQPGEVLTWTNGTGSDVASGSPVAMQDTVGIATVDIADTESGSVSVVGVYEVTKGTGETWSVGQTIHWDASAGEFVASISAASGDVENCGVAAADAESADAVGMLKLTPGTGTYTA